MCCCCSSSIAVCVSSSSSTTSKQATSEHSRTQKAARITKTVPRRNRNPLKRYLPLVDANKLHQSVVDGGLVEEEWEGWEWSEHFFGLGWMWWMTRRSEFILIQSHLRIIIIIIIVSPIQHTSIHSFLIFVIMIIFSTSAEWRFSIIIMYRNHTARNEKQEPPDDDCCEVLAFNAVLDFR